MLTEWNLIPEALQLFLAREALRRASDAIAGQAEVLAEEMEAGSLIDQGGPDALRLLAAVVRANGDPAPCACGRA
jgi:hypothetical protein